MARPTGSFLLFAFLLALATPAAAAQGASDEKAEKLMDRLERALGDEYQFERAKPGKLYKAAAATAELDEALHARISTGTIHIESHGQTLPQMLAKLGELLDAEITVSDGIEKSARERKLELGPDAEELTFDSALKRISEAAEVELAWKIQSGKLHFMTADEREDERVARREMGEQLIDDVAGDGARIVEDRYLLVHAGEEPLSPAAMRLRVKLATLKVTLNLNDSSLTEVLAFLRKLAGMKFVLSEGVEEKGELTATAQIKSLAMSDALDIMLNATGEELEWVAQDNVVMIRSKEEGAKQEADESFVLLDIRDILCVRPGSSAAEPGSEGHGRRASADATSPAEGPRHAFEVPTPAEADIPEEPLAGIVSKAKREKSSALIILRDGKLVVEEYFGGKVEPLTAMSASKSVAALAAAHLAETEMLHLDKPLNEIFPGWDDGEFEPITVRHLLNHTSGLANDRANFLDHTVVEHAMKSERVAAPGTEFRYNNNAVDLLSAIFPPLSKMFLDEYLQVHFFGPMDIVGTHWTKDIAGNPRAAGAFKIHAIDLAKLGQLMLNEGKWGETQILQPETVRMLVAPSQRLKSRCGLLWWREQENNHTLTREILDAWKQAGLSESSVAAAKPLIGKKFSSYQEYLLAIREAVPWKDLEPLDKLIRAGKLPWSLEEPRGELLSYSARGWLGQFLVVVPSCNLVAVRMRAPVAADYEAPSGKSEAMYNDFPKDILDLARSMKCIE